MIASERWCSPNEGLRTLDAPDGTAAGGLNEIVPCAAANVEAHERPIKVNERRYIANEGMQNRKQSERTAARDLETRSLCIGTDAQS